MNGKVLRLATREQALLDGDMIRVLQATLGTAHSQELVEDAAFQLSERLSRLEHLAGTEDFDAIHRLAHGMTGLAGQVGLMQLAAVARDLSLCARNGDPTAIRAVSARLIRLGEESLFSLARFVD